MQDEQRKDEEAEVEAHKRHSANEEPSDGAETEDDFEAHRKQKD